MDSSREDLSNLTAEALHLRKREWNRAPLQDLFPRIPATALETILSKCSDKDFHYNLSESKHWNARRYDSIVIAHVRHFYSDYDKLLTDGLVERYEARRRTSQQVWKILRGWCPWETDNENLERCFQATLLPREERDCIWDPMDVDDSDDDISHVPGNPGDSAQTGVHGTSGVPGSPDVLDDPMDLD